MAAALNRFISKSSDKCYAFFHALKGKSRHSFKWTMDCDSALTELKEYLSSAPLLVKPKEYETLYLYLVVSAHTVSSALVRRVGTDDLPIYFTSKTLLPVQTRYLPLEKLALALADLSNRVSKWTVELANFDIRFEPRTTIKGQILADFIAELTPKGTDTLNTPTPQPITESTKVPMPWQLFHGDSWRLHVDGASNSNGAGAGVVLVSPCGTLHESSLSIDFPTTNNEAKYEAILAGLCSAVAMKVSDLVVHCDSQLTVNQINREHNAHADALAGLASASKASEFRTINFGSIDHPSFDTTPEVLNVELGPSWMDEIITFLKHDTLPVDKKEAYRIRNKAAYYWLSESGQLYRKSFSSSYLLVVHLTQNMKKDCGEVAHKCRPCQLFSPIPKQPAQNLSPIISPWPFAQWGLDIVGKLPTAPRGFKFLITATDYFSKWVEAEPLATITEADIRRFVWRNIVTRFGAPYEIVSDNGSQFVGKDLTILCAKFGIRFFNSTPAYPQGNCQVEATNKTVCAEIKHRLNSKRGKWAEELPRVLWAYRSTPRRSTGQTPFSMAFGMEAVIPLESRFPTLRIENFDPKTNDEAVEQELVLAEEKRDDA
ncbi:uncharacterized protein LOC131306792 [Rhododendron vialii]|uniref:uncharacterized protein LOC131306792 n=1 Tax=Rhododendron vialii TaxID=182163 RepID=UPI00265DED89|nr:uncharacterized protein LOC131306792 [Rhododendron vialii]